MGLLVRNVEGRAALREEREGARRLGLIVPRCFTCLCVCACTGGYTARFSHTVLQVDVEFSVCCVLDGKNVGTSGRVSSFLAPQCLDAEFSTHS